jgi:TOBE domain
MNFIAARLVRADVRNARVHINDAEFDAEVNATHLPANAEVTLGVRPEHVQIVPPGGSNSLQGLIGFIEQLGEASYIYVRLAGGELVTVRESGQSRCTVGEVVHLQTHRAARAAGAAACGGGVDFAGGDGGVTKSPRARRGADQGVSWSSQDCNCADIGSRSCKAVRKTVSSSMAS